MTVKTAKPAASKTTARPAAKPGKAAVAKSTPARAKVTKKITAKTATKKVEKSATKKIAKSTTAKSTKSPTAKSTKSTTEKPAKATTEKSTTAKPAKRAPATPPAPSPWLSSPAYFPGQRFWLMKSEPETFSIDDLASKRTTPWEGVRNYTARNFMRDCLQPGDGVLFYHSSTTPPGVVGLATVVGAPYPDPTAFDPASPYHDPGASPDEPRWILVDVGFVEKLPAPVPLERLRDDPALQGMLVAQKGQRLSVQPVLRAHFEHVARLGGARHLAELLRD